MTETYSQSVQLPRAERIYGLIALLMGVALIITIPLALFDGRTIDGSISVWAKPLKFELSLVIHAATLAMIVSMLSHRVRFGWIMMIVAISFAAASILEMTYIISQAARAEASHFNVTTTFHRMMWSLMAFAAVVIIGAAGAIGLAVLADREAQLDPGVRWSIALGLIGGTLLTLYTAFTIGGLMTPYIGDTPNYENRMPFTGWSLSGGDLRVSHFLATHMIQIVPIFGFLLSRIWPSRFGVSLVFIAASGWTAITLVEYQRALAGLPTYIAGLF